MSGKAISARGPGETGTGRLASPMPRQAESCDSDPAIETPTVVAPLPIDDRPNRRARWLTLLMRSIAGTHALSLADQAVVSATNFLTTILIGRWCGAEALGVYAIGFSLTMAWICVQDSLIVLPYTINRLRPMGRPQLYAGSSLAQVGLLSVLAILVSMATAVGLSAGRAGSSLVTVIWIMTAITPFTLLREFGRRFAFAHLRVTEALVLNVAVAALQFSAFAWLAWMGSLSAPTAFVAIGVACALPAAVWLYVSRRDFAISWERTRRALRENWSLGKWLFAWQATSVLQANFIQWLLAAFFGTTATGVYAACMTVPLFANPLILGVGNALAPTTAHAYNKLGGVGLRRVVFQTTILIGTAMTLFCVVVTLSSEHLLNLLYHGRQYEGHGGTVAVLTLAMLATALGISPNSGLMAVGRSDVVFKLGLLGLGVSVVLVPGLVFPWGLTGAACAFLAGNLAGSAARWLAFLTLVPRSTVQELKRVSPTARESAVLRVLQQIVPDADRSDCTIEKIGEGVQSHVYVVRSLNRRPIWQSHPSLVVKVYKPDVGVSAARVHGQSASLDRLHAAVNGSTIDGWKIFAPAPVHVSESPLALVMTMVPGRDIDSHLESDAHATPELLEFAPRAVVGAMKKYWSLGGLYGAMSFCNILYDGLRKELSFIDVGLESDAFLCAGVGKRWYPASRDLAYVIYQTGVRARSTLVRPELRHRQQKFTFAILLAYLQTVGSRKDKQSLLDEIQACTRVHLQTLNLSWSLRGLWYLLLRQIASRRIDHLLLRLRNEAESSSDGAPAGDRS